MLSRVRRAASSRRSAQGSAPRPWRGWLTPLLVDYISRDGSTLLMRLLATSDKIALERRYPYEFRYFSYLWHWAQLLDRDEWDEGWDNRGLETMARVGAPWVGPPPWLPRELLAPETGGQSMSSRCFELAWGEFSNRAARRVAAERGSELDVRYYAEKHLGTMDLDWRAMPPLELIVLVRDPRDVYVSREAFFGKKDGVGADRSPATPESLSDFVQMHGRRLRWARQVELDGNAVVIRYDELVNDLHGVASRIERTLWVELDPDEALADAELRRRHVSAESPEASIGRWHRELSPEVAEVLNDGLREELASFGFGEE
jgi:Sulfotransferase family